MKILPIALALYNRGLFLESDLTSASSLPETESGLDYPDYIPNDSSVSSVTELLSIAPASRSQRQWNSPDKGNHPAGMPDRLVAGWSSAIGCSGRLPDPRAPARDPD